MTVTVRIDKLIDHYLDTYRGKRGFLGRVVLMVDRLWLKKQIVGVLRIKKEE